MIRVVPIDFVPTSGLLAPADPALFEFVKAFCEDQLGAVPDFVQFLKSWAVVESAPEGHLERVWGVLGLVGRIDVPTFHIRPPEDKRDLEQLKNCFQARDLLIDRARAYLEDQGARGHEVFVYIAPQARNAWERYLKKIRAQEANRVIVEV